MYHGIINVYKEKGMTSFDVVARLRKICGQKKIGHTGTLDPDAEGVLPVCLGKATKVCDLLTDQDKEYAAVLRLGIETDTQDLTGKVIVKKDTAGLVPERVTEVIHSFVGTLEQMPPMYSAKKINGKKLYEYAREGIEVTRKPETITIYDIEILQMSLPEVSLRIACSKGTYIRTLCHDIGQKLGTGGVMASLLRTKAAGFESKDAYRLSEIAEYAERGQLSGILKPVADVFTELPAFSSRAEFDKLLVNGSKLPAEAFLKREPQNEMEADMPKEVPAGTGLADAPKESSAVTVPADGTSFLAYTSDGAFAGLYYYSTEEAVCRVRKLFYTG